MPEVKYMNLTKHK